MWWSSGELFESAARSSFWPRPATWPAVSPATLQAMRVAAAYGGNASSVHRLGQRARGAIEAAEQHVLALFGQSSGQFCYTHQLALADGACVDVALRERVGVRGGCVWFFGDALSWCAAARLLVSLRGGTLAPLPLSLRHDLPVWQWAALPNAAESGVQQPPDVVAMDLYSPTTGRSVHGLHQQVLRAAAGAHVHLRCGALAATYTGEPWPLANGVGHTLSVASEACGGPPGLAAAIALQPGTTLPPQGTTPRELVVGLGAAALERAEVRGAVTPALQARASALLQAACLPAAAPLPLATDATLIGLLCVELPFRADAAGIVMPAAGCNFALAKCERGRRVMRVWLWPPPAASDDLEAARALRAACSD